VRVFGVCESPFFSFCPLSSSEQEGVLCVNPFSPLFGLAVRRKKRKMRSWYFVCDSKRLSLMHSHERDISRHIFCMRWWE